MFNKLSDRQQTENEFIVALRLYFQSVHMRIYRCRVGYEYETTQNKPRQKVNRS